MIIERMQEYLQTMGISTKVAEEMAGISQSTLSKAFKNGTSIGTDKLENFLNAFKDISPLWILRGEGNMILGDEYESATNEPEEETALAREAALLRSQIVDLKSDKERLLGIIEKLTAK